MLKFASIALMSFVSAVTVMSDAEKAIASKTTDLINQDRSNGGLGPLGFDLPLESIAIDKAYMISRDQPLPVISLQELSANVPYVVQAFLPQLGLVFAANAGADFGSLIVDDLRNKAGLLGDYNLVGVGI